MSDYLHHIRWAAAFLAREQRMKPLSTSLCAGKSSEECFRMMHEYYGSEHMSKARLAVYESRPDLFYLPPPELDDPELTRDTPQAENKREPSSSSRKHDAEQDCQQTAGMGEVA